MSLPNSFAKTNKKLVNALVTRWVGCKNNQRWIRCTQNIYLTSLSLIRPNFVLFELCKLNFLLPQ